MVDSIQIPRANLELSVVGQNLLDRRLAEFPAYDVERSVYGKLTWSEGYDVVIHNECFGAIEDVGLEQGYGIVRGYVGHGIGNEMHEEPQVTNYRTGRKGRKIEVGLCIAIEPMFTTGHHETRVKPDGWTVATADGSLAAHWEHTIAVTEDGPRILTLAAGEVIEDLAILVEANA